MSDGKCVKCNGIGQRPCAPCNGLGKTSCPKCGGSRLVDIPTGDREITMVTDKGPKSVRQPTYFRTGCDNCGATGEALCLTCNGSRRQTCGACGGSGRA